MSGNLLAQALLNLPKQTAIWYAFTGNTTVETGDTVSAFANGVNVQGSWQPIARKDYQALGLDMQKQYVMFFTTAPIVQASRGRNGDEISYMGTRFVAMGAEGWQNVYAWDGIMLQSIGPG